VAQRFTKLRRFVILKTSDEDVEESQTENPRQCHANEANTTTNHATPHLMIDADDTLWENNVFFENLIEDFITIVEPYGYARAYIRHILNETERRYRQYGYGRAQLRPLPRGNLH